jgi:hypothetical protein
MARGGGRSSTTRTSTSTPAGFSDSTEANRAGRHASTEDRALTAERDRPGKAPWGRDWYRAIRDIAWHHADALSYRKSRSVRSPRACCWRCSEADTSSMLLLRGLFPGFRRGRLPRPGSPPLAAGPTRLGMVGAHGQPDWLHLVRDRGRGRPRRTLHRLVARSCRLELEPIACSGVLPRLRSVHAVHRPDLENTAAAPPARAGTRRRARRGKDRSGWVERP